MNSNSIESFIYAREIEQGLVSLCFYDPERLAIVYQKLDPALAITQPHLRHILEAIKLAYCELGATDFPSVITVLREEGQLEACGGLDGVNQVLEAYRYPAKSPLVEERIFAHYLDMLARYAVGRANNMPVFFYNRGDLLLKLNKCHQFQRSPHYLGQGKVNGRLYTASAYQDSEGTLSVSLLPK